MPGIRLVSFFQCFAFIFAGKLAWLFVFGPAIEADSGAYTTCVMHFEYPWAYPYFLHLLRFISSTIWLPLVLQAIVFSLAASLAVVYFFSEKKWVLLASLILALDPVSGYFCSALMSEALFMALMFPWMILLHRNFLHRFSDFKHLLLLGALTGIMYQVRFAGTFFLAFPAISALIISRNTWKLPAALILFLAFQLTLVPVRMKYLEVFGTPKINTYSAELLWNNAACLYPGSTLREYPENAFEKHLQSFGDSAFDPLLSAKGRQMWAVELPFRSWLDTNKLLLSERVNAVKEIRETAWNLMLENPFAYFTRYVFTSVKMLFSEDEVQEMRASAKEYYFEKYGYRPVEGVTYKKEIVWIFFLFITGAGIYIFQRRKENPFPALLMAFSVFYSFSLLLISIPAARLFLVLVPMLLHVSILTVQVVVTKRKTTAETAKETAKQKAAK